MAKEQMKINNQCMKQLLKRKRSLGQGIKDKGKIGYKIILIRKKEANK